MKKLLIVLNQYMRKSDIEEIRKDIAKQLDEGLAIVDSRVKDVMIIEECQEIVIKGGD